MTTSIASTSVSCSYSTKDHLALYQEIERDKDRISPTMPTTCAFPPKSNGLLSWMLRTFSHLGSVA